MTSAAEAQALANLEAAKAARRENPTPENIEAHRVAAEMIEVVRNAERKSAHIFPQSVAATSTPT